MGNKPKMRFKGFTDDWEQRKLGDIGKARSGIGFPDNEQGGIEGIPFFKVSDMNLDGNEIEMTVANNYVTAEQIARKKWSPLDEVPAMYFAKVGAAVMLNRKRLCRFPFLFDNNTMAYSLDMNYWNTEFAKAEFAKIDLTKLVQVGALPSYNAGDVEEIEIMIPSLGEQIKIGEYFTHLDHLVTLQQRKCDGIKNVKKSMLEKMFPQNGKNVPELRFKGFTDDWEQRKFGDIALRESVAQESSFCFPSVEYEDVVAEEGRLNKNVSEKKTVKKGVFFDGTQVLYGKLRPYLHNWLNPDFSGVAVGDWWVLKPNEVDKTFLYRLIQTRQFDDIANQSAGSKMPRADWNLVSNSEFALPSSLEEQAKIGEYFSRLDHLIALQQRKLELLQNIKKSCLEKMFA